MKKFQYQIIRYMHDRATAEFVNVGIVVYQPGTSFLQGKFATKFSRISQFFTDVNGPYLISTLRHFEHELSIAARRLDELFTHHTSLLDITNAILTKDDSALYCSDLYSGIDIDPQSALDDLFDRMINKYIHEHEKGHDDHYAWSQVYKQYFDKYNITEKLKSHAVKTSNDTIEFDKAWKNGTWNCFQTLSFDVQRSETIKNKVYKWSGILGELEQSGENLHVYFLTLASARKDKDLDKFIEDTIRKHDKGQSLKITLVKENEADTFAAAVKKEIEEHAE